MKTPDEIKKGLQHCCEDGCKGCPYEDDCNMADALSMLACDALAYIQQLENHIGEFTEKVSQLEAAQPKWISVKDRLPDGSLTKCLVAFWSSGEFVTDIGFFCGEYGWDLSRWATSHIDYWMPMPEPPKEGTDEKFKKE